MYKKSKRNKSFIKLSKKKIKKKKKYRGGMNNKPACDNWMDRRIPCRIRIECFTREVTIQGIDSDGEPHGSFIEETVIIFLMPMY